MPSGEQKVFRSFEEMRAHFFPKQAKKEAERAGVKAIIDRAMTNHKRKLSKEDMELMREMDLARE